MNAEQYDGNASTYDWIVDKGSILLSNGELALTLTQATGGTRISSTRYLNYGNVTARLKTGRWAGVVTAFITMSSIKDEIDWEFPGAATTEGQTNYFWRGIIAQPNHGEYTKNLSDTYSNYHDFTIDWRPDTLSFLVDGKNVRTVHASDTQNNGVNEYPNTPSRIQLSIWPAGINSSAPGVVDWAGGMINWDHPDYKAAGYFAIYVSSVSIQCGDPTTPNDNTTSYVYGSNSSSSSPDISFSGASTSVKEDDLKTGSSKKASLALKVAVAVGGMIALLIILMIIGVIIKKKPAKPNLAGLGKGKERVYQPLKSPLASVSVVSHGVHNRPFARR